MATHTVADRPITDTETYAVIGKPISDIDIVEKVQGAVTYTDDIKLPGMLYGKILRSKYPHAKILNIDVSKAKQLPGVKAVITGKDIPNRRLGILIWDKPALARDKVRFIGDVVVAVAAIDPETAEEACGLIRVDYEKLPAVFDPEEAMKPDAPLIHEDMENYEKLSYARPVLNTNISSKFQLRQGDIEEGFIQADFIFEDDLVIPSLHTAPMEPHTCLAKVDALGNITIWSSTQSPYEVRDAIASYLGIPFHKVRIVVPFLGGGFGGKFFIKGELICALLARAAKKPVKMVYSREEAFIGGGVRHSLNIKIKSGVTKDGKIVARHCTEIWNTGAYADAGPRVMLRAMQSGGGAYKIPNIQVDAYDVYTNNPTTVAYRGFGANQPTWAAETHMDIIAEKMGIDPLEFRMRNALEEGDLTPTGQVIHACGLKDCLRALEDKGRWSELKTVKKIGKGVGISCFHKGTNTPTSGSAFVKMNQDGSAELMVSVTDMGQGTPTVLAQIVAEELTIPVDKVKVSLPDTQTTPYYTGTTGSRAAFVLGNAVKKAAEATKKQLLEVASELLEIDAEKLEIKDSKVLVTGEPDKTMPFSALPISGGKFVSGVGRPVVGAGFFSSGAKGTVPNFVNMQAPKSSLFWMYGAHLAEVEVDIETGKVKVTRVLAVHNIGKPLNPLLVDGQIEGGVMMAMGEGLYEAIIIDKGVTRNDSFRDYKVTTFTEAPKIERVFVEVPHRDSAFGGIGIGEAVVLGVSAAIGNAIYNAVGVRIEELPITAEKVLKALEEKAKADSDT